MSYRKMLAAAISIVALATAAHAASVKPQAGPILSGTVLDGVTIVDTRDGSLHPNKAILIEGDRIARIARAGSLRTSGEARTVAAKGKYVVPGYLDMHAHPLDPADPRYTLPMMVAYGVTGYRQMGGSPELLAARRDGKLPSGLVPELLGMPGLVMAAPILSQKPENAAAEVRSQREQGADFVKLIDMVPASFFAAMDEAHRLGIPAVGHLPPTIDVREAARRGMYSIEHLGPNASILEACSTDEEAIRAGYVNVATNGRMIDFKLPKEALKRLTANPVLLSGAKNFEIFQHILDSYDDAKCRRLAKTLAGLDSWQVPTLIREKSMELGNDATFRDDPRLKYVPGQDRALWNAVGDDFDTRLTPADRATLVKMFDRQLKLTKLFDEEGVKMLAGSDMGGGWLIAGVSLHQEFDLLAQAGLSPLRILQMTTLNGARFLKREDSMGTVDTGKRADLVILDGNPVASVENLHKIAGVVLRGRYLSGVELAAMKDEVAALTAP